MGINPLDLLHKSTVGQAFSLTLSRILMDGRLKTCPTNTFARSLLYNFSLAAQGNERTLAGLNDRQGSFYGN
jgi:hypothetical protein